MVKKEINRYISKLFTETVSEMLTTLRIKNYALIENLEIDFYNGLNIITGETGAGKSILIGALNVLLGERTSADVIRKGASRAVIEAVFEIKGNRKVKNLLKENEFDNSDYLILRRELSSKGLNRNFVNDTPARLNIIKEIGNLLVDIHGQHEHQSLLKTKNHIEMLDEFGDYSGVLNNYKDNYSALLSLVKEFDELVRKEKSLKEKSELYEFQLKEIEEISPEGGEDEKIEGELKILENAERILELTENIYGELYDSENSITERLGNLVRKLNELTRFDSSLTDTVNETEGALSVLDDVARTIISYKNRIELDPERLEELRERLGSLNLLKKKYGGTLNAVLEYQEKIRKEYELSVDFSERKEKLLNKINLLTGKLKETGILLSQKRKETALRLKKDVESTLKELGINEGVFVTEFDFEKTDKEDFFTVEIKGGKYRLLKNGLDKVEFLISTNLGEEPKPLAKVASGGEISRIMLAMKSSLAKNDKLPLLIFDEIDVGVSGRIARKVGEKLKNLSSFHQIITITHLPQIAAFADHHFKVEKKTLDGRVISRVRKLNDDEKIREIASLLSGENVTDSALISAKELLQNN